MGTNIKELTRILFYFFFANPLGHNFMEAIFIVKCYFLFPLHANDLRQILI